MKTYTQKMKIDASAEALLQLLITTQNLEDEAKVEGALSSKARIEKSDANTIVLVNERQDPGRTPTGRDPKKPEKTILTVEWDLKSMKSKWNVRVIGSEKLAHLDGGSYIEACGADACYLCENGNVDIKLPLVGNIIAGIIVNDLKRDFPKKIQMINKKLAGK